MKLPLFELFCLLALAIAYGLDLRDQAQRGLRLLSYGLLCVCALAAEHLAIELYGFYRYSDGWSARLGHVPLLVPLIWPLVVLSGRTIVATLWPGLRGVRRYVAVAAIVFFDATLMEVAAVAAGYWRWAEGGYLQVPLMGLIGWGCFAFAAEWIWDLMTSGRWKPRRLGLYVLPAAVVITALTHGLILICWWGAMRWVLRGDLGPMALGAFALLSLAYAYACLSALRADRRLNRRVLIARVVATLVFVALLFALPWQRSSQLWLHFALVSVPYLLLSYATFLRPLNQRR